MPPLKAARLLLEQVADVRLVRRRRADGRLGQASGAVVLAGLHVRRRRRDARRGEELLLVGRRRGRSCRGVGARVLRRVAVLVWLGDV